MNFSVPCCVSGFEYFLSNFDYVHGTACYVLLVVCSVAFVAATDSACNRCLQVTAVVTHKLFCTQRPGGLTK